jgi:hypothetical protein
MTFKMRTAFWAFFRRLATDLKKKRAGRQLLRQFFELYKVSDQLVSNVAQQIAWGATSRHWLSGKWNDIELRQKILFGAMTELLLLLKQKPYSQNPAVHLEGLIAEIKNRDLPRGPLYEAWCELISQQWHKPIAQSV